MGDLNYRSLEERWASQGWQNGDNSLLRAPVLKCRIKYGWRKHLKQKEKDISATLQDFCVPYPTGQCHYSHSATNLISFLVWPPHNTSFISMQHILFIVSWRWRLYTFPKYWCCETLLKWYLGIMETCPWQKIFIRSQASGLDSTNYQMKPACNGKKFCPLWSHYRQVLPHLYDSLYGVTLSRSPQAIGSWPLAMR